MSIENGHVCESPYHNAQSISISWIEMGGSGLGVLNKQEAGVEVDTHQWPICNVAHSVI